MQPVGGHGRPNGSDTFFSVFRLLGTMTERTLELVMRSARLLAVVILTVVSFASAAAQQNTQNQKAVSLDADKTSAEDASRPFAGLEEEMRAKRAIKFAEKEYQENLDRARDLSSLGASIVASFKQKKGLDQEDIKKLEKSWQKVSARQPAAQKMMLKWRNLPRILLLPWTCWGT